MTVTEVRQDPLSGFDDFVAAEGESLLRLAFLLTTETEPAVAVFEDALARAYGCWPRLSAASANPHDYVRRLLVQEATETHRLRRPAQIDLTERVELSDPIDLTDSDDDLVVALRALPADERAATVLRHCLDLSEMETAATLGCTVGAVRRQTIRALGRLRYLLAGSPTPRPAAYGVVELMRHLQASLAALPDRLELRPAPDLLRKIRLTHARRLVRRRTVVLAVAASMLMVLAVIVLQLTIAGGSA